MALPENVTVKGYVYEDGLPSRAADGEGAQAARFAQHGEAFNKPIMPWRHALCDEGSYHEFHNTTLDDATTLAGHAAPVVADIDATFIKPFFFLGLIAGVNTNKRLYLDFIEVGCVTPGTNGTDAWWADETDAISRYTSGGTALTIVNPNTAASNLLTTDVATFKGGDVLVPVETSSNRKLGFDKMRVTIEVAQDITIFQFGDSQPPVRHAASPTGRTTIIRRPPVIITPGFVYMLGFAAASQSVASVYKVRGGCYYR